MREKKFQFIWSKENHIANNWTCDPLKKKELIIDTMTLAHCMWLVRSWTLEGEPTPVLSPNHCNFQLHSKYSSSYSHRSVVLTLLLATGGGRYRKPQLVKLQRSTNFGVPFPRQHFCKLQLIYILKS